MKDLAALGSSLTSTYFPHDIGKVNHSEPWFPDQSIENYKVHRLWTLNECEALRTFPDIDYILSGSIYECTGRIK